MTVDDSVLQSLEIDFSVNLNWLTENNIDKENVTVLIYNDGIWEKLSTTYISEDDIYAYYHAIATGTSTFAIVEGETTQISSEPGGEEPEEGVPWFIIIGAVIVVIVLLIIFLFKAGYLYFEQKDKNKGKNKYH